MPKASLENLQYYTSVRVDDDDNHDNHNTNDVNYDDDASMNEDAGDGFETNSTAPTRSLLFLQRDRGRFTLRDVVYCIMIFIPWVLLASLYGWNNLLDRKPTEPSTTLQQPLAILHAEGDGNVMEGNSCDALRKSHLNQKRNVYWDSSTVSRESRYAALQQKGATFWFTGLSGSGKSTIGRALEKRMIQNRIHTYRLDGDNVRMGLNRDLGFSPSDRQESVRRVGEVAALFADAGVITIVGLVSPYLVDRHEVRLMHEKMNIPFFEVFVDVPVEVVKQRDPKGLYAKAIKGEIKDFTGISAPYEAPIQPDIHLRSHEMTLEDEVDQVFTFMVQRGLFNGAVSVPSAFPGIALPDGGNAMSNLSNIYQPIELSEEELASAPRILLRDEDVHWVQVLGEGWAAPLKGFMKEAAYLESLHFSSILYDSDNLTNLEVDPFAKTDFAKYQSNVKVAERVSMPIPIVLPINEASKRLIAQHQRVVLVNPAGQEMAVLDDPEIYEHRKEERIARTFGTMDPGHPYIVEIQRSGNFLLGGEIKLLSRIRYKDGLDSYRLTPQELREKFNNMGADAVVAFQTRNPTHAGHAYLMRTAREQLLSQGFKNPVLWLSPLGGWTKPDDVPLDVRVQQHEAILRDGMLDHSSTILSIWPSPMLYAGPREVLWHAKSRKNAGASYFIVGRDPAGIKRSDHTRDAYVGEHGRFVLHLAPGLQDMNILSFAKVYYDRTDQRMKLMDRTREHDFLSISGSKMRRMARRGLNFCSGDVPLDWEENMSCVPPGFMSPSGWDIVSKYYQKIDDQALDWIPYATSFVPPRMEVAQKLPTGRYGTRTFALYFLNDTQKQHRISPWHNISLFTNGDKTSGRFNFVVEIPRGQMAKMEMNKYEPFNPIKQDVTSASSMLRFHRYGIPFFNYGMFPQTWEDPEVQQQNEHNRGGDNDPLDVIEVSEFSWKMGSVVPVKVLGAFALIDAGEVDHKIVALAYSDPRSDQIHTLHDLEIARPGVLAQLIDWLVNYKTPDGKEKNFFQSENPLDKEASMDLVMKTHALYTRLISNDTRRAQSKFWFPEA